MTSDDYQAPPETLWHYTDAAGLLGILGNVDTPAVPDISGSETYKPVLWASAAQFLNDSRELVHGLDLVKRHINNAIVPLVELADRRTIADRADRTNFLRELCKTIDTIAAQEYDTYLHCCTISFSKHPDMLSQWRSYGRGVGGFAIGFSSSAFPRSDGSLANDRGLGLRQVAYVSDRLPERLQRALSGVIERFVLGAESPVPTPGKLNHVVTTLALLAASIKHEGFAEEEEWRHIEPGYFDVPEFRATPAGLVPYRKLTLRADAVTGLYVGPGPRQYENYVAATSMLHRFGYAAAARNVHCSKTPFR